MTDYTKLIEQLRTDAIFDNTTLGNEAADAIEALQAENERLKVERERNLDSIRVNNEIIGKKNAEIDALAAKLVPLTDAQIIAAYEDYCGYARGFFEADELHDLLDGRAHSGVSDFIAGCKAAIDAAKGGQHEDA